MAEPQLTDESQAAKPAATPILTDSSVSSRGAASPTEMTTTAVTAEPLPAPGTPPPAITPPSGDEPLNLNPKLASLHSIFPHFDPALLESVLDSVDGNEERAADVLLSMSDPEYVSNVTVRHQPTQEELDAELARRLMLEDSNSVPRGPAWQPQAGNVPYQTRYNQPHPQMQGQGQGQGQSGMQDISEQFNKFAQSGKKTITNIFNIVKAKVEEFDSGGRSNQAPPPPPQSGPGWAGQSQSYYAPPENNMQYQPNAYGPPPQSLSPAPPQSQRGLSDTSITLADNRSEATSVPPTQTTGMGTTGTSTVDTSRVGLLPKRPVSLVGPRTPIPAAEPQTPTEPEPHQPHQGTTNEDEDELGYVENPFEEDERHR